MLLLALALLTQADTSYLVPVAPAESLMVTVRGTGPPVVMIPGLFGSAYSFRQVSSQLDSAGYWTIVIEPLAMGSSSRPADADYSLTAQVDRIAAVLDTLGVTQSILVAHSVGASIALRLAYRRPDLTKAVISIEGGPGESATTAGFQRWLKLAPIAEIFGGQSLARMMVSNRMRNVSADESWVTEDVVDEYIVGMVADLDATIQAYKGMATSPEPELLGDNLDRIVAPVVLLLAGEEHDTGPSIEEIDLLATRVSCFSKETVADTGFFIHEEQPAAVTAVIVRLSKDPTCPTAPSR